MTYKNIILGMEKEIAFITFNRPKALNALNSELFKEFTAALEEIENNQEIQVLILTGSGDKAFVAGADITELAGCNPLEGKYFSKIGQEAMEKLQGFPIPVIAAVNGFALGGGTEMALACDFVYASETATFGLPEITLGIIPGFGGTQRLPRLIGPARAKELVFTGKMIPAQEALDIGIVNRLFPLESLMDETIKTAKGIAQKGKSSLRAAKEAINAGLEVDIITGLKFERDAFAICMASSDAKEGTTAFLEKRKPVFNGQLNK